MKPWVCPICKRTKLYSMPLRVFAYPNGEVYWHIQARLCLRCVETATLEQVIEAWWGQRFPKREAA